MSAGGPVAPEGPPLPGCRREAFGPRLGPWAGHSALGLCLGLLSPPREPERAHRVPGACFYNRTLFWKSERFQQERQMPESSLCK